MDTLNSLSAAFCYRSTVTVALNGFILDTTIDDSADAIDVLLFCCHMELQ